MIRACCTTHLCGVTESNGRAAPWARDYVASSRVATALRSERLCYGRGNLRDAAAPQLCWIGCKRPDCRSGQYPAFQASAGKAQVGQTILRDRQRYAQREPMLQSGTVVDAAVIAALISTKNISGKSDPDLHQTKKGISGIRN